MHNIVESDAETAKVLKYARRHELSKQVKHILVLQTTFSNFVRLGEKDNRKHRTKSSSTDVTSGLPQGLVLGALLFLCFMYDLPEQIKYKKSKNQV